MQGPQGSQGERGVAGPPGPAGATGQAGEAGKPASAAVSYREITAGASEGRCADDEAVINALLVCAQPGVTLVDDPARPGRKIAQCVGGAPITQGAMVCLK
ncbi:MAG: hypothetical protein BGP06_06215 [Rhizobiales bacterium 65-9]|nr:MAG: hypothetical protein BGP06_06215 [Rhizobiales bacterium 65-9]